MRVRGKHLASAVAALTLCVGSALFTGVLAGDSPAGFWYGADCSGPGGNGTTVPYLEPTCGGLYGSYVGRINESSDPYNHALYSNETNANYTTGHGGLGSQNFFALDGPKADPNYTGTTNEASGWGELQASTALSNWISFYSSNHKPYWPLIYADIEPGNPGWLSGSSNSSINRAVFNGFWDVITGTTESGESKPLETGLYISPSNWATYFSGQTLGSTFEWTPVMSYSSAITSDCPTGFSSSGGASVQWPLSGDNPACEDAWQWVSSVSVDYDQVVGSTTSAGIEAEWGTTCH